MRKYKLGTSLVFVFCLAFTTVTGAEFDPNCIQKEVTHMGVTRTCCQVTCGPGKEPKLCMENSPYTSSCHRCRTGTYNPREISLGESNCLPKKNCDEFDHMIFISLGNLTHDAECGCEEGFTLKGDNFQACVWDPVQATNTSGEVPVEPSITKESLPKARKLQWKWTSFFIGGCTVFLGCFIGVGLWCFFVYCNRCRRQRKSDYDPVSWTNLKSKKQRILGCCYRDRDFQRHCWLIAVELVVEKIGQNWKQLGHQLFSRAESAVVLAIEGECKDDAKEKARVLLQQWKLQRSCDPNATNEEIIGHLLRVLQGSGHVELHDQIVDEIWERFGDDLKNHNGIQVKMKAMEESQKFYYTEEP